MLLAQSRLSIFTSTVPIAAITTVIFGYILAVVIAHRQEVGKQRAAAEARIRHSARLMAQDVAAAVEHYPTTVFSDDLLRFEVPNIGAFTIDVVEAAWSLPRHCQKQVRAILVDLVGNERVLMAERFGSTLGPRDFPLGEPMQLVEERFEVFKRRKEAAAEDEFVHIWDPNDAEERAANAAFSWKPPALDRKEAHPLGRFGGLETHYLVIRNRTLTAPPDISEQVAPVLAELERLLAAVGGVRRLGKRARLRVPLMPPWLAKR
ncbi:hypothetical protein OG478_13745 [Streptomyces phaeochromogenes]|uniref:hypothetical protein n=1 Tax=Streptomyces phaeochromogenes TaxID=1923 RepID=UPI0038685146|nr:hypothetical protein OG478_13745 [Streptomyces phaeochromogenes]